MNIDKILGIFLVVGGGVIMIASMFSGLSVETNVGLYNPMMSDGMNFMLFGLIIYKLNKLMENNKED